MKKSETFDTEISVLRKLNKREKYGFWMDLFKNPMSFFEQNTKYSIAIGFIFLIPFATVVGTIHLLPEMPPILKEAAGSLEIMATASFLILFFPMIYFEDKKRRKIDFVEEKMPGLLRDLSTLVENGLTVQEALLSLSDPPNNFFLKEIRLISLKMRAGISFEKCLDDFGKRYQSKLIRRAASVIGAAEKSGGRPALSVGSAAFDLQELVNAKKERESKQNTYGVILFISFFIFLGIAVLLVRQFTDLYSSASAFITSGSVSDMAILIGRLLLIQAFFLGLFAGKLKTGTIASGLKYSGLLMAAVCISFAAGTDIFN
ncbi:hypothetical protein MsAg5_10140 [Methanosarcinaceae archaeon Ag5]|uniref:Type II secretion system protein GspF domain-containing protein n=1 Tax=Methanolapillus africanus TaxID=3028297 RepID=A0AAE4MJL8_9EURY|nr:hypothetical protein [Methanosarcinaceae archaeon Ag5]